jgi:hypothetical protein
LALDDGLLAVSSNRASLKKRKSVASRQRLELYVEATQLGRHRDVKYFSPPSPTTPSFGSIGWMK